MTSTDMNMQFGYHRWATTRLLNACGELSEVSLLRPVGGAFGSVFAVLVHSCSAEDIWLARWQGEEKVFTPTDAFADLEALREAWTLKQADIANFLQMTDPNEVFGARGYRHPLWQMLLHLVDHGSFHRGQTMHFLREAGVAPPPSNFIHYLRARADDGKKAER